MTQPGWYPDPQDPGRIRYFDGQAWTEHQQLRPETDISSAPPAGPWAPTAPASAAPPWTAPTPSWVQPPPVPKRRGHRRVTLIAAVVVVVLAGGGLAAWRLTRSSAPSLTYQGHPIADPAAALSQTEASLSATVSARHGVKGPTAHCYYTKAADPAAGAKRSDIGSDVLCGPVLFVDDDPAAEYLAYRLTPSTGGSSVTLSTAGQPNSPQPESLPAGDTLTRPDGQSPPPGSGGLTAPAPPPAAADVLVAATLGAQTTLGALADAEMISRDTGVAVVSAGTVARYGQGDDARSAPTGQTLVAFELATRSGDVGENDPGPDLALAVDGQGARRLPTTDDAHQFIVAAVPDGQSLSLALTADGYRQTLSLPDGRPGASNLTVLTRKNRIATLDKTVTVPIRISDSNGAITDTWPTKLAGVNLQFWPNAHPTDHPARSGDAFLFPDLTFTDTKNPGGPYGFDTALLSLRLPNGTVVHPTNLATGDTLYNVFEVPGTFTTGTIVLSGSEVQQGVTISITAPISIPISLAAG